MFTKTALLASSAAAMWAPREAFSHLAGFDTKVLNPIGGKSGVPEYLVFVPAEGTSVD